MFANIRLLVCCGAGFALAAPHGHKIRDDLPLPVAHSTDRAPLTNPVIATYYPDWAYESMTPEQVDFTRFDWVDFGSPSSHLSILSDQLTYSPSSAFAIPTSSFGLEFTQDNSPALLNRLVSQAHTARKRVKLSVGGWSGSKYFSPAVATSASRATFVGNILAMYGQFDLDGVDMFVLSTTLV